MKLLLMVSVLLLSQCQTDRYKEYVKWKEDKLESYADKVDVYEIKQSYMKTYTEGAPSFATKQKKGYNRYYTEKYVVNDGCVRFLKTWTSWETKIYHKNVSKDTVMVCGNFEVRKVPNKDIGYITGRTKDSRY